MGSAAAGVDPDYYDAVIVGAGFSGLATLLNLRRSGFKVKVFDDAPELGGTWYWNRYPGARVDSVHPIYQLLSEDCQDFEWKERFSGQPEIRAYFAHLDKKLELSKDIKFNTLVESAQFSSETKSWVVKTSDGEITRGRHLVLCTGVLSQRYTPPFPGLASFQGQCYHTAAWPKEGVNLHGKKVGIIGTGASAIQTIQEIGPIVSHLTVYQRTPNLALPMQQVRRGASEEGAGSKNWKFPSRDEYQKINKYTRETFAGFPLDFVPKNALDDSPEDRQAFYEQLWEAGGFSFWIGTYQDILTNPEANETAYAFWRDKTRARINDPTKQELLAPMVAPHAFGTKRPSLEQNYYEIFNQENVDIVDVNSSPILEITPKGVKTAVEGVIEVDVLILATGFDSITGRILSIELTNEHGLSLRQKWADGTCTYLGMTTSGFPNLYFFAGPHAPTAFANGPTLAELQSEWLRDLLVYMRTHGKASIKPRITSEHAWTTICHLLWNSSLHVNTKSWWQGSNIPGKKVEALNYIAGIPEYMKMLRMDADNGYEGFTLED